MCIAVAIFGLGNCASSFTQGLEKYRGFDEHSPPTPGLMHPIIGKHRIRDIRIAAAFDVHAGKVGKDVAEAIYLPPNNSRRFADVPLLGIPVSPGFIGDGIAESLRDEFPCCEDPGHVVETLRRSGARVALNLLPTGSHQATRFYAEACMEAGVAFINGIPVPVAADLEMERRFREAGLPLAGDDVMSQFGATRLNVGLAEMMTERGLVIDSSVQTNVGGNMDFRNLADKTRIESKLISKREIVVNAAGTQKVWAGPTGYDPALGDRKIAEIRIEGRQFGDIPFELDARLSVDDSPNCAGVLMDTVRLMEISRERGLSGSQPWSVDYFKRPPKFESLQRAFAAVRRFVGLE